MILRHFNVVLVILFSVLFYITLAGFESYSVSPQSCSITSALKSTATQPEEDLEQILRGALMVRGRDLSDFERGVIVGARMAGVSVTKAAQLTGVSIGTVTKVTAAYKTQGKSSVSRVGNCGRQRSLGEHDARALVQFVKKNRSATLAQVTESVNAGRSHSVSARTVRRQLHREGYYKEVTVPRASATGSPEDCGNREAEGHSDDVATTVDQTS
uniref:Transposase Tc1-like domain-containing protein n=2 Tax=Astatotilapia calliptera TaxID=8154 RepID=A0AAX7U510_ASTCA